MLQDLRFAFRMLVKDPGFTAVAVLALSLGIGMNTTVFTFVNAVLIKGLPYEDSHEILHLDLLNTRTGDSLPVSWPEYVEWRNRATSFASLAAFRGASMNISEAARPPERVSGALITTNMFSLLRVQPHLGRDFREEDGRADAAPVLLISHAVWTSRYGADPNVIGTVVKVNDTAATIVGVMPDKMQFPQNNAMWRPLVPDTAMERRDTRNLRLVVRLAPGVTRARAQAEMSALAQQLQQQFPDTNKELDAQLLTFNERFNGGPIRLVFLALLGAVGFVLLIACANVANLLLARSTRRSREVAIRFALGASRARVVRQLLIESLLLACAGGAFGLLLAWGGIRAFDAAVADTGKPYWITFSLDPAVFGYLALICLSTAVLFGLAPAVQVSRTNVNELMKEGGRGTAGGARARWMRSALVIGELALTVVLLIGAGLMVRSFLKLYDVELGIAHTDRLLTLRADLPAAKYDTPERRRQGYERILTNIARTPGVAAAALSTSLPMGGGGQQALEIEGRPLEPGTTPPRVVTVTITPGYFDTVGAPLKLGRLFTERDGTEGHDTVIVNEAFAGRFFPSDNPVGRRVRLFATGSRDAGAAPWLTVVGVSPTIQQGDPQDREPAAVVYQPYRRASFANMGILVRAQGDPSALAAPIRRAVQEADPEQPVFQLRTMNDVMAEARWPYRVFGSMFAIFALVALALSAVGLYAVTSYSVTQRTPEIGVRMALGAAPNQVWWLVLKHGMLQLTVGLAIGLALGWPLSRVLQVLLVQIPAQDPVTFAGIALLLTSVMLMACLVPARRATRLDPLAALRVD